MYCQKCGQQNQDGATLCVKCGAQMVPVIGAAASVQAVAAVSVYAGFWKRFAAFVIDYLLVVVVAMVAGGLFGFVYGMLVGNSDAVGVWGLLVGLAVWWLYYALMESSQKQATFGKMALGIKVTDHHGTRISFGRATGRLFAKFLSGMILAIGYVMAGFTAKKQALHDMIAGSLVVNGNATAAQVQAGASVAAAGMPWWAIVLIVMGVSVFPLGIVAAIAIPAYQDSLMRARVADALAAGSVVRRAVTEFYAANEKLPGNLEEAFKAAGENIPNASSVRSITLDAQTSTIRITLAQAALDGKSILLVPTVDGKTIHWRCYSNDAPRRYLPSHCREDSTPRQ